MLIVWCSVLTFKLESPLSDYHLFSEADNNIGHVPPGEPGPQPRDGMEGVDEEQSAGIEPPH